MEQSGTTPPRRRFLGIVAAVVLCVAAGAVYVSPKLLSGQPLIRGVDYPLLHIRRIAYAREALLHSDAPHLPGWYSRELLGSPFWANVQNFPFIPNRLLLLLLTDERALFSLAMPLAAALAALFTYLYCRRMGLSIVAACAAGWTFAASGYFAARVRAGHLALLEAYCALPLLLWLIEGAIRSHRSATSPRVADESPEVADADSANTSRDERRTRYRVNGWLLCLGLCSCFTMLAGHPQIPVYAMSAAALYAVYRAPGSMVARLVLSMVLGAGVASFALVPMMSLVGRSTRILPLERAGNDIPMPYARLTAFLFPWQDGTPKSLARTAERDFLNYPSYAWFFDTVCYVGWMPLAAVAVLWFVAPTGSSRGPPVRDGEYTGRSPWTFMLWMGIVAILMSLPFWHALMLKLPGTILRSPSRLLYLTTFVLCIALALGIERVRWRLGSGGRRGLAFALLAVVLVIHVIDLGTHARAFVVPGAPLTTIDPELSRRVRSHVGDGLAGIDWELAIDLNRSIDDAGFYDAIALARTYRAYQDLLNKPLSWHVEDLDAAALPRRALQALGVKLLVTRHPRPELDAWVVDGDVPVSFLPIPEARQRAEFFAGRAVIRVTREELHRRLRAQEVVLRDTLMLATDDPAVEGAIITDDSSGLVLPVEYRRHGADKIGLTTRSPKAGYLRVIEACDPGWRAEVDGTPVSILAGDDLFITVPVPAGTHEVTLTYHTPGASAGAAASALSLVGLVIACCRRRSAVG